MELAAKHMVSTARANSQWSVTFNRSLANIAESIGFDILGSLGTHLDQVTGGVYNLDLSQDGTVCKKREDALC